MSKLSDDAHAVVINGVVIAAEDIEPNNKDTPQEPREPNTYVTLTQ